MAYCVKCGAQLADNARFCTSCGADQGTLEQPAEQAQPQYGQPYAQPAAVQPGNQQQGYTQANYSQPAYAQPGYDARQSAPKSMEAAAPPMGTWGYVGSLLLMGLPVAGFILAIVWACGGTNNVHRRNLARAMLILMAIGIVLGILLSTAIISLVSGFMQEMGGGDFMYNWQLGMILSSLL
ncbi:MAG: zinc-ribbon domain-containing protein [Bacillota bacterium]